MITLFRDRSPIAFASEIFKIPLTILAVALPWVTVAVTESDRGIGVLKENKNKPYFRQLYIKIVEHPSLPPLPF